MKEADGEKQIMATQGDSVIESVFYYASIVLASSGMACAGFSILRGVFFK